MILKHIYRSDRWPDFRTGCRKREDCMGLLNYLMRAKAKPSILHNDFDGATPIEITDELMACNRSQDILAYHVVASYPPEEDALWQPQAEKRIREFQNQFGITKGFWVQHDGHWHGFLNAMRKTGGQVRLGSIDADGQSVPVARTLRLMAQKWEDETPGSRKTGRDGRNLCVSREALAMAQRQYLTKKSPTPVPTKLLLKAQIDRIVALSKSFDDLQQQATAAKVTIQYKRDADGKVLGISFSQDGVSLRGRDAGYSYRQLQQLYENTNNASTPDLCRHPRVAGGIIHPDRDPNCRRPKTRADSTNVHPDQNTPVSGSTGQRKHGSFGRSETSLRTLNPTRTFLDLIITLTIGISRLCRQQDYRRRYHKNPPPYEYPTIP